MRPLFSRGSVWPAAALGLLLYALLAWRFDFVCDDAYISFRYSRHLAEGHGLVFNLGRATPVEGYSNFLWVVWLALFERLGVDITVAARVSSALAGAALIVWVTQHATRRFDLGRPGALATALFLGTLPPMAMWATGGLAAMPLALCIFACYERLLGDPGRPRWLAAGIFGLLAALLRADGLVWVLLVLAAAGWTRAADGPGTRLRAALVRIATLVLIGVGAHVAWRYATYGDWLPNTARVKAGFSIERLRRGFDYLAAGLLLLPSLAIVLALAVGPWGARLRGAGRACLVVLAGTFGYAIWVGGDFMPFGRFLLPTAPFMGLLFAAGWRRLAGDTGTRPRAVAYGATCVALSLLACFDVNVVPASLRARFHFRADRRYQTEVERWREMRQNAERWVLLGRALALHVEPGDSIVLGAIGAVGYHSELFIYDEYGLVSPEVVELGRVHGASSPGHDMRVNKSFFFAERPTYGHALLTTREAREPKGIQPWWADVFTPNWAQSFPGVEVKIERHRLAADDGFPAGAFLNLLRLEWSG
ncbi:MAG: hypothetical protein E2O39_00310 [Planctomycetota bacterium]|nr:MAG: hypothetical protein E2O39_00310 [Planctomycetota bacterium]